MPGDGLASRPFRRAVGAVRAVIIGGPNDRRLVQQSSVVRQLLSLRQRVTQAGAVTVRHAITQRVTQRSTATVKATATDRRSVASSGRCRSLLATTSRTRSTGRVTKRTYSITDRSGATTVVTGTYTSPTNALGLNNGTTATSAGSLTAAVDRTLSTSYSTFGALGGATVQTATLSLYHQFTAALTPGTLTIDVTVDGVTQRVLTTSASVNALTAPLVIDLLPRLSADRAASLSSLRVTYRHVAAAGALNETAATDASVLAVTAQRIDTP